VLLKVILMSFLYFSNNDMIFKIIVGLVVEHY
jgi:hypothetical protein